MFNSKYSKVLSIILIIAIIGIIGILIFLGLDYYKKYIHTSETDGSIEDFDGYINNVIANNANNNQSNSTIIPNTNTQSNTTTNTDSNTTVTPNIDTNTLPNNGNNQTNTGSNNNSNGSGNSNSGLTYKGFNVIGKIKIPQINIEYQVLEEATPKALETSVCKLYGVGINQVGNTVIIGHNFKDGTFFSNNQKLSIGDKIYLTDLSGNKVTYEIYKKYTTDTNDFDYATRDTNGKREISLSTCTDDTKSRLIIWAKEV